MNSKISCETVIIGGGAAGLSAAMLLGRARRRVVVVDAGNQSNNISRVSHGVFSRDGIRPQVLYKIVRRQLAKYSDVALTVDSVITVTKAKNFTVHLQSGKTISAKTILLAQGINYNLPGIPGVKQLYGTKIWHCPFCEGYEATDKKLLAVGDSEWALHMLELLPSWTNDITWSVQGQPNATLEAKLKKGKYQTIDSIIRVKKTWSGINAVTSSGSINFDQAVMQSTASSRDDLADSLGCKRDKSGNLITDEESHTTTEGVFAAGDQASPFNQVNLAVATGHAAGIGIHTFLAKNYKVS